MTVPVVKRRPPLRGFNLIEVMVSGVILLLGLAGILVGISTSRVQYSHQRHMTQALQIAESVIEELLVRSKESPDLAAGQHDGPSFEVSGARAEGDGFFDTIWIIDPEPLPEVPGIRRVTVTVSWEGALRPVSLSTFRN